MSKELIRQAMRKFGFGSEKYIVSSLILGFILILGLVLRFYDLGSESFWLDEVATTIEAQQSIPELLTIGRLDQPPAYYLPIHFWIQVFGVSEVSLRSFSALAGMGSIILIYLIGRPLFGNEVGLLGAFFMAVSEFQIGISQEARNYSLFEFAILLSFFFFVQFVRSRKMIHLILYGISSAFMVNSNAYGVFILVGQNLFFVLQVLTSKRSIVSWIVCQACVMLAVIPYLAPLLFGGQGVEGAINLNVTGVAPPLFSDIFRTMYRFMLPPRRYFGMDMIWSESLIAIYAMAAALLVVGILITIIRQGKSNWISAVREALGSFLQAPDMKSKLLLVGCWLLCPLLLPFIISQITSPIYSHKYVIGAASALYLLLALGLFWIRKIVPLAVSLSVFMVLAIPGLTYYYVSDTKEQWRDAAAFVEGNSIGSEVIIFAPNDNIGIQQEAFDYYYQGSLPGCSIGPDELSDKQVSEILKQCISGYERFWVVMRNAIPDTGRYRSFFLNPDQSSMHLIKEQGFIQITVYLFELKQR